MGEGLTIRRDPRVGDLDRIVAMHARVYGAENGVDARFVEMVAAAVARARERGFPSRRERIWIVEHDGAFSGSLALTDEGDGEAMVRWFLLRPSLRGAGLGRRLLGELLAEARSQSYQRVCLETFSELEAAAHLYRDHGFELVSADTAPRWGREAITYQRYELALRDRSPRGGTGPRISRPGPRRRRGADLLPR
jgi:GNAT superfamily N-acetyltransferase